MPSSRSAATRNELTGLPFVHARVRTLGGSIDVVAAAGEVQRSERATLALADCRLVGNPLVPPPAARGWLRRLFGRQ